MVEKTPNGDALSCSDSSENVRLNVETVVRQNRIKMTQVMLFKANRTRRNMTATKPMERHL